MHHVTKLFGVGGEGLHQVTGDPKTDIPITTSKWCFLYHYTWSIL